MPDIKVQHVVSCSSEDLTHKADNLLKSETYRKWKCSTPGQRQISIILQFEKSSTIHSIDVGNEGSAFVEILVGHSTSTDNVEDWQVILVTSSFMSPVESKNSQNLNRVRMFGAEKLSKAVENKKWDRVKIVCSQPFNKHNTYGLSFIKFHSPPVPGEETSPKAEGSTSKLGHFKLKDTAQSSSITPGSYFKNRAEKDKETPPLTGAAAVRAASNLAAASIEASKTSKQPSQKRRLSDDAPEKIREKHKTDGAGRGREEDKRDQSVAKQPPVKKRRSEAEAPKQSSVSFKKLLEGVTFVMSGFQNPFRAELRDKAVEMGAKYKPDWGPGCTHLICAFANTPKYNQVEGKGKIVKKQWILDCHRKKVALPWKSYKLTSNESSSEEESESEEEEEEEDWEPSKQKTQYSESRPSPGKGKQGSQIKGKSPMKKPVPKDDYGSSTDEDSNNGSPRVAKATVKRRVDDESSSGGDTEDELRRIQGKPAKDAEYDDSTDEEKSDKENSETENNAIPELPDFFNEKNFLIYGGSDMGKEEKRQVKRFIIAFGGNLENYMKDSVQYVITNSVWDDSFDQALTENASLAFIKPKWLYKCNEKSKFVPYQPFVVVPN